MNFNFGEVLARAWQITWKYKILWLAGIIISLVSLLSAPISLMTNPAFDSLNDPSAINRQLPLVFLSNGLVILLSILSIPISVIGLSMPSLATLQLEKGSPELKFGELLRGILPYFWRILGVFLIVWVGTVLVVAVSMGCVSLLGVATMGIGMICLIPMFILLIPLMILVYAMMEQGMAGVLVDNLGVSGALKRAWELVKKNIGVMALMSIIIYMGSMIVGMIISIPMMIPMFGFIFSSMGSEPDLQSVERLSRSMVMWMLAFSPFYAVLQGVLISFTQSAWTLTYLRLTRSAGASQPVLHEAPI